MWIQKHERYNISRVLYEALLEELPMNWIEKELIRGENKENFASFGINQLFDSDFNRKP